MKIELKELVGHLPHELQIAYFYFGKHICTAPMVASMIGNSFTKEIPINAILTNDADFKPILHPLSDLTKEIEHNGERFVPIIELYRLSNEYYYRDELDYEFIDSWVAKGNILKVFHDRSKDEYTEFVFGNLSFRKDTTHSKGSFVFGMYLPHTIRVGKKIHNPYLLFQKLHEWHFDIHNWIERGLAIDINTLNHA